MNQETSRTIQEDQKVNFGVNLSGKYGPYVEFSSNFALETSQSVEETNSNSSNSSRLGEDIALPMRANCSSNSIFRPGLDMRNPIIYYSREYLNTSRLPNRRSK